MLYVPGRIIGTAAGLPRGGQRGLLCSQPAGEGRKLRLLLFTERPAGCVPGDCVLTGPWAASPSPSPQRLEGNCTCYGTSAPALPRQPNMPRPGL